MNQTPKSPAQPQPQSTIGAAEFEHVLGDLKTKAAVANERAKNMPLLKSILSISVLMNIVIFAVVFGFWPKTRTIQAPNGALICEVKPLDEAWVDHAVVEDFASRAAVSVYSFSYTDYRDRLPAMADRYFTFDFRTKFLQAFGSSEMLRLVNEQFLNVTAVRDGPPDLNFAGQDARHRYYWDIDVPLQVTYHAGGTKTTTTPVLLRMHIVRSVPTRFNSDPIAVDNIDVRQRPH
jgi:hypothetical protein